MRLSGYVQLTAHGFALPAYAAGPSANAWYCAIPAIEGDHATTIEGFALLEDEEIVPLPENDFIVGLGDPWQDVFLWAGRVFTGTPRQIFDAIGIYRDELLASAPLSYLDLAVAAESPASADVAASALTFLEVRLGGATGAASFRDLVLRPGVLIELRRQFQKIGARRLPDHLRDFSVREYEPGQFEVQMVPGSTASVGGYPAAAELTASIARFGDIIGLPIRTTGLDGTDPAIAISDGPAPAAPPRDEPARRAPALSSLPNILVIAADRRAAQIAGYLEPPLEIARGAESIWRSGAYRIERVREAGASVADDALIQVCGGLDPATPLDAFAAVVWLAGNEAIRRERSEEILAGIRSMNTDTPFLIALAPPADGPSTLLADDPEHRRLLLRCNAIIDTTIARSPFWSGQPRRSVDRRIADIVATVSIVAAVDGSLSTALRELRGSKQPRALSFIGGTGKFNVRLATASEFNAAGAANEARGFHSDTRLGFELWDRSSKRPHKAFLELQPIYQDFALFAEAAVIEALGPGVPWPGPLTAKRQVPASIRRNLDNPELAVAIGGPGSDYGLIVVTAETPSLASLREAEIVGGTVVRYTDVETIRALMDRDRIRKLPSEIHLPALYRYPRNRRLATRGVDTRDVLRMSDGLWDTILSHDAKSELGRQVRRYLAAIDNRGEDREVALPVPAIWNAFNAGDELARDLVERFPRLKDEQVLSGKRTADLMAAWSHPAPRVQRWAVEDGRIPVELKQLENGEVPAQRLFFIDGDTAVPVFLLSRLFAVWARSLLPSSTSWASRFQVSKTFDAFPFPRAFAVRPAQNGNPPHLRLSGDGAIYPKLAALAREAHQLTEAARKYGDNEQLLRSHPTMRQIDALLLQDIELSPDASDLDILENLIERNQRRI